MWISKPRFEALVRAEAQVEALNEMIERLNSSLTKAYEARDAERKRSDNAVDRLLNSKGLPAVTPPEKITLEELSSMFEETPEGIAAVREAIEKHGIEDVLLGETG